jgi:putative redox protein
MKERLKMDIKVTRGEGKLQHVVEVGPHKLIADAPSQYGGDDAGFTPHDLLASSLGACTALTLNMYAQRKGFDLQKVDVVVEHADKDGAYVFNRHLTFHGDLTAEQKTSLVGIADKCPIHKILSGEIKIITDSN